jgi:hypothetical protein
LSIGIIRVKNALGAQAKQSMDEASREFSNPYFHIGTDLIPESEQEIHYYFERQSQAENPALLIQAAF